MLYDICRSDCRLRTMHLIIKPISCLCLKLGHPKDCLHDPDFPMEGGLSRRNCQHIFFQKRRQSFMPLDKFCKGANGKKSRVLYLDPSCGLPGISQDIPTLDLTLLSREMLPMMSKESEDCNSGCTVWRTQL